MLNFPFVAVYLLEHVPTRLSMKMSEIIDLSSQEIEKKLRELGEELLQLQVRKQTGQVEKPHMIKSIRRDRARLLTQLQVAKNQTT